MLLGATPGLSPSFRVISVSYVCSHGLLLWPRPSLKFASHSDGYSYMLLLWSRPSFKITSYSFGYSYGLFLWANPNLKVTSYSYGYSSGLAPASELPATPIAIPPGLLGLSPSLRGFSCSYSSSYGLRL